MTECRQVRLRLAFVLTVTQSVVLGGLACSTAPSNARISVGAEQPSYVAFRDGHVSDFLVRRCGTLDCHGRPERPLRLFGQNGLRLRAQVVPEKGARTTEDEHSANWIAVVGLEPEQMKRVVAAVEGPGQLSPLASVRSLLLVSKPLGCSRDQSHGCDDGMPGVEHKGGPVLAQGDDGYVCLVSWLRGAVDPERCCAAANAFSAVDAGPLPDASNSDQ